MGTMDTFVTYCAPANLIETVNTMGSPIYARQIARNDGSAIDVKTEASVLTVNKRPRLAVKIFSSTEPLQIDLTFPKREGQVARDSVASGPPDRQ